MNPDQRVTLEQDPQCPVNVFYETNQEIPPLAPAPSRHEALATPRIASPVGHAEDCIKSTRVRHFSITEIRIPSDGVKLVVHHTGMASKMAKAAMAGAHTAGIYADMTVDGPDIGTLVVIVDRAKNLPNRKTMGKQDPYCAARLGKEAKKTETDKRGGQTPRWDNELRFTVSVFNDDKKTDLIGETWVPLAKVVVPGGGQNDLWHNLNCKGRYAGEIRIELTYYDTRPKEEKPPEAQASPTAIANKDRGGEALGGPRQPKPVKRRPLPADPISASPSPQRPVMPDHAQSSPLPYTPQRPLPQGNGAPIHTVHESIDYGDSPNRQSPQFGHDTMAAPAVHSSYPHASHGTNSHGNSSSCKYPQELVHMPQPERYHSLPDVVDSIESDFSQYQQGMHNATYLGNREQNPSEYQQASDRPPPIRQQPAQQDLQDLQDLDLPQSPEYGYRESRPSVQPVSNQHNYGGSHSSPADTLPQHRLVADGRQQRQYQAVDMKYSGRNGYDSSPLRHQSFDHIYNYEQAETQAIIDDEGPPPLPPAHRSVALQPLSHIIEHKSQQTHPPITAPAPLNIRHGKRSLNANLPPEYDDGLTSDGRALSASPSNTQLSAYSAPAGSSITSYSASARRKSEGPASFSADDHYNQEIPPSLVPGYDPSIAEAESARMNHEKRMSTRPNQVYGQSPTYTALPVLDGQQRRIALPQYENSSPVPVHERSPVQEPESRQRQLPFYDHHNPIRPRDNHAVEPRSHRASRPTVKPGLVSPDPRTPMRKSVSPHPEASPCEQRVSPIPFSPDSYEEFNPNLKSGSSINKSSAKYNTPEQARDAARLREQEEKVEEGPIIGNDGRIIDPSDHLPTETWAPEPE
ncbi:MAG: hypothetical protein Q9187_007815, partial [Circinaria calcarea]